MKPNALEQPEVRSQRAAIRRAAVMQAIRIARLALQRVTPRSCKWLRLWGRNCDKMKGMLCERFSTAWCAVGCAAWSSQHEGLVRSGISTNLRETEDLLDHPEDVLDLGSDSRLSKDLQRLPPERHRGAGDDALDCCRPVYGNVATGDFDRQTLQRPRYRPSPYR